MHELLESKVSRERFGIEVDKMMRAQGRRPIVALELMQQSRLLAPVFLPRDFCAALPAESGPLTASKGVWRGHVQLIAFWHKKMGSSRNSESLHMLRCSASGLKSHTQKRRSLGRWLR